MGASADGARETERLILQMFRTIDERDWTAFDRFFHPDVVYERPGYPAFSGIERLGRYYAEERVIAAGEHHLESIVVDGQRAGCFGRFVGTHRDGSPIDERFADAYELEGGKIRVRTSYFFRPAV